MISGSISELSSFLSAASETGSSRLVLFFASLKLLAKSLNLATFASCDSIMS